jgi:hypothetical protein
LFVWGNSPEIYYYSNRVMGARFPFCNYLTGKIWGTPLDDVDATGTEAHIVREAWPQLLADLTARPPRYIVDAGAGRLDRFDRHPIARYPQLQRLVESAYRLEATVAGVPIYRLATGDAIWDRVGTGSIGSEPELKLAAGGMGWTGPAGIAGYESKSAWTINGLDDAAVGGLELLPTQRANRFFVQRQLLGIGLFHVFPLWRERIRRLR